MKLIMALTTVGYISIGLSGAVAQNTGTPGQNLLNKAFRVLSLDPIHIVIRAREK
ncbi:MAG TPA: hypothetical protein VGL34_05150 [Steroidobacteraceae bacterium]|jgi:hypothetical protein